MSYVEFSLDALRIAFALEDIQRVVRAVAVTPVPGASPCVLGVIDVHGAVMPVFDTRVLLGLPRKPLRTSDHIMIAQGARPRAFIADEVRGSFECADVELPESYLLGTAPLKGVARRKDGMILVHDMKQFMSLDHAIALNVSDA